MVKIDPVNKIIDTTPKKKGRPKGSVKNKVNVIWAPQERQTQALVRNEFEILYGGARGGGKTDAGLAWLMYDISNPKMRALVIRQNAKDLSDWVDRARKMYAGTGAEFVGSPVEIRFPSGAKIRTGHLKDENAYEQYQGHEYQKIVIEELTQIPSENSYEKLISSCRTSDPSVQPQIFCTTNPGGPGHEWVKERWGIVGNPKDPVVVKTKFGDRVFIPATVHDNPHLLTAAPHYVEMLKSITDDNLRKSWYEGSWDDPVLKGRVYDDEVTAAILSGRVADVPHDVRYPVYTYWDIGVGDATAIGFFQKLPSGQWHMIDYYEDSGKSMSFYRQILDTKGYFYGSHYGPHDLRQRDKFTAETTANLAAGIGINFIILPRAEITEGIRVTKMKFPLLWIDKTKCSKFLDAIKRYRYEWNEEKQIYTDKPIHDWSSHAADMLRYWGMALEPVLPGELDQDFSLYTHSYS